MESIACKLIQYKINSQTPLYECTGTGSVPTLQRCPNYVGKNCMNFVVFGTENCVRIIDEERFDCTNKVNTNDFKVIFIQKRQSHYS